MRSAILKSVLSVALCSIVAMLAMPCQAKTAKDGKYNPVSALAKDQNPLRWQQQLKWTAGAYELEYPELKLLGWREVGVLNNQKDIDQFIAGNVDKDKLYSHIIDYKNKKYEIAPLSQLAKKYDVWKNANFDSAKRAYGDKLVGEKVVELQWQYKGKKFVEKIAVTDKHDEMGGILFSAIKLPIDSNRVPLADWQRESIKQHEKERQERIKYLNSPEGQKMLKEHMRKNGKRTGAGA